ncbi:mitochondrial inner membrane protein-domain-containing protein, partial [Jimgerdemannia flammicorona]
MLRATRLSSLARPALHATTPRSNLIVVKRFTTEATTTTATTTAAETPKKNRLGRRLLTTTFLAATAFGGAVVYSFKNEVFRDTFTSIVPGTEELLDRIEVFARKDEVKKYREKAVVITQATSTKAKEYGVKAKDATADVYVYVSDTVGKLTGSEADPAPAAPQKKAEAKPAGPAPSKSTPRPASGPAPAPGPTLIPVPITEPVLIELSRTIDELSSILNDAGLADKSKSIVATARTELAQLSDHFKTLRAEESAVVSAFTDLHQKTDRLQASFDAYQRDLQQDVAHQSEKLQDLFDIERRQLLESSKDTLISSLAQERLRHAAELSDSLVNQAVELQRKWVRDIMYRVENERAGRLAKLDNILIRLRALERISLDNAERIDTSSRAHQLWTAVRALSHAVHQNRKTPFADELDALTDVAGASLDHAEIIKTVVASIDDRVAEHGVHSVSDLTARFAIVREEVTRASLVPEDGGFMSHFLSVLLSKVMFRKHGLVPGNDVEAICARTEWYLHENDLDAAAREINQLQGWPKKLARDWIEEARKHLEVKQALEV